MNSCSMATYVPTGTNETELWVSESKNVLITTLSLAMYMIYI